MKRNYLLALAVILLGMAGLACSLAPGGTAAQAPAAETVIVIDPTTMAPLAQTTPVPAANDPAAGLQAATPTVVQGSTAARGAEAAAGVYGPSNFPASIDPLTGKEAPTPALLDRRPVAVKIQMFPRGGRPPSGVSMADIVYDYYQNFGMTRFHAIFYSTDVEKVGPVRSARLLDIDLVNMYKSIFAFGSAEQRTFSRLFSDALAPRLVLEGSTNCPPMCREDPNGSNHLVTSTKDLSAYITQKGVENKRQKLDGMSFNPATPAGGAPLTQIFVRFSISAYTRWDFEPASGRYLRFQDTVEATDTAGEIYEPLVDKLTNQQIAADNVVVLVAPHDFVFGTKPGQSEVVKILLEKSGPGYAFRDGQVFEVTWHRDTPDAVISLTLPDGTLYPFKPGNTWFEVVGKSTKIDTQVANVLRFNHSIP